MSDSRGPTFWLNVTTSFNWKRGAVGIVRVEQELNRCLAEMLADRFQTIVFHEGEFIPEGNAVGSAGRDEEFWPEPSYGGASDPFDPLIRPVALTGGLAATKSRVPKFRYGDVLITVGLDWEYPGLHDKIRELKKKHGLIVVTCCYDLIPILFPQYCVGDVAAWFKNYLIDMTWLSDGILCISDNTRRDYLNFARNTGLPPRVTEVIELGSSLPPRKAGEEMSPEVEKLLQSNFHLFVSTIERRKNHEVLYRAYHIIRQENPDIDLPKLVFVGMQGWGVDGLMSDIRLDPLLKDDIVVLPHVSDAELSELYARCDAFLYPSLYEGWGLPIAEALQFGRPVLASSAGSIPEVGGDLVRYLDPWAPREWANALLDISSGKIDLGTWSDKITNNFKAYSWSNAAATLISMADGIVAQRPTEIAIEPGYEMSSINGVHYGSKIIYDRGGGMACHGPYIGVPRGQHCVTAKFTFINGKTGFLRFLAAHDAGKTKVVSKRVEIRSLKAGDNEIQFPLNLGHDVADLEIVCEVHETDRVQFSVDKIVIQLNPMNFSQQRDHTSKSLAEQA